MIDTLYNAMYIFALIFLAIIIFTYLFRSVIGPTFFDRILGVNNITTIATTMICILAIIQGESYIVDIALIYAMIGFVTVVIVCKSYLRSHSKSKENDFEHLKESEVKND